MRSLLVLLLLCSVSIGAESIKARPAKRPKHEQVLLMVHSSQQKAANEAAVRVLGPYGRDTFSVPRKQGYSTYYVAAIQLTAEQEAALRVELGKLKGSRRPQVLRHGKDFRGRPRGHLKAIKMDRVKPKKSAVRR